MLRGRGIAAARVIARTQPRSSFAALQSQVRFSTPDRHHPAAGSNDVLSRGSIADHLVSQPPPSSLQAAPMFPLQHLLQASTPQELHAAIEPLRDRLGELGPMDLAAAAKRCEALGVRHEGFLMDVAWSVLQHKAPSHIAPSDPTYLADVAAALATTVRVVTGLKLNNDYHFVASAFGRCVELTPHMHGQSIGEVAEAVRNFDRMSFSFGEADALATGAQSGLGGLVGANGVRDEPYAPEGGTAMLDSEVETGRDSASEQAGVVSADAILAALNASSADARRCCHTSPSIGDALAMEEARVKALDDADRAVGHPTDANLIDAVLDACEQRALELCDHANALNAEMDGLEMPELATDAAAAQRHGTGGHKEQLQASLLVAKESAATGVLPRVTVLSVEAIRSLLGAVAEHGVRDERLLEALARQLRAGMQQYGALHRCTPGRDGTPRGGDPLAPRMVGDARKDAANPLASFREDGSGDEADAPSWRIGPYSVMDLLDMASAAAAVVPRITDVLEPEAQGRTGIDARTSAAMPVLSFAATELVKLPFDYIGRTQPDVVMRMRQLCERMPVVAEACPPLWDKIRTARVKRERLSPEFTKGKGYRGTAAVRQTKGRMLGSLANAPLPSRETWRRNKDVESDVPLPYRRSYVSAWEQENRKQMSRKSKRNKAGMTAAFVRRGARSSASARFMPKGRAQ